MIIVNGYISCSIKYFSDMYYNEVMVDGDLNVILLNLDVYHILSGIFY